MHFTMQAGAQWTARSSQKATIAGGVRYGVCMEPSMHTGKHNLIAWRQGCTQKQCVPTYLEGNAHALPALVEHGAAAVAAVDGCVNLHPQQVYGTMAVLRDLQWGSSSTTYTTHTRSLCLVASLATFHGSLQKQTYLQQ
eukprot:GHRQ01034656.1.p1 GENE.GHRQ01034656.1~~GHRQ01034656.1.p1  ORF type:complete len:139 (+),score=13.32 GHRQ01034656.1:569-985(+)